MATLTGTDADDTLTGSEYADTFFGLDGNDLLVLGGARFPASYVPGAVDLAHGGNGNDLYRPSLSKPGGVIIEDNGLLDSGADMIGSLGALTQSASFGYSAFSSFERLGDDLHIVTAGRPYRFHHPGINSVDITITDQYGPDGSDKIEYLQAGGVTYSLVTGNKGSSGADILAGKAGRDVFFAGGGDDYVTGNAGKDRLYLGAGNDFALGGNGADRLFGKAGNDHLYGDKGNDRLIGGTGFDWLDGGEGNDLVTAGKDNDTLLGGNGNDRLFGQAGDDWLSGGDGNDMLSGGRGSDTYRFTLGPDAGWGQDIINEKAINPIKGAKDTIDISGVYGPSSGDQAAAISKLSIARVGDDMVISALDSPSDITVLDQFSQTDTDKSSVEQLLLNGAYWNGLLFQIRSADQEDLGDDRGFAGRYNELLFGTQGADSIFGDAGSNLIWTGDGADVLVFKEANPDVWYGTSVIYSTGGSSHVVMDFDPAHDTMDFTEIRSIHSMDDLDISTDAQGDAYIYWDSGTIEIANLSIELRGVDAAMLGSGHFLFSPV